MAKKILFLFCPGVNAFGTNNLGGQTSTTKILSVVLQLYSL
jgi:hypothetical protein